MHVTTPVEELTVPTAAIVLLQTPPLPLVNNVVVAPTQVVAAPLIVPAFGSGLTVTIAVAVPPVTEYDIVAVPAAPPVTIPVFEPTVAMLVLPLLHTPPVVASLRVVEAP
jgi:hypothetical protein